MNTVVVWLASPREWRWRDWSRMQCLAASIGLAGVYLQGGPRRLPMRVFHEDYTPEDEECIRRALPATTDLTFERVDFSGREAEFVSCRPSERVGSYGYAQMCRFFCGPVQDRLVDLGYDHYIRLDDDSYILAPVHLPAIFEYAYTWRSTFQDPHRSLHAFTREWLGRRGHDCAPYTDDAPYTNFHASRLDIWRRPLVRDYLRELEAAGAYLTQGWDDAMIASQLVRSVWPALGIRSIGPTRIVQYRHNQHCAHAGACGRDCDDGTGQRPCWGPPVSLMPSLQELHRP